MNRSTKTMEPIGKRLFADHARLSGLFDHLLNCVHVNDQPAADAAWTEFEGALLAHLETEEVRLLPAFALVNKEEVAAIRQDHARIRYLLAEMGVRLELHCVKEQTVERFIESLRAHAEREEHLFYEWANREMPDSLGVNVPVEMKGGTPSAREGATKSTQKARST